jgi:hypothetical protein
MRSGSAQASKASGRNSLRQQGIESPLSRFPSGESRGGRVPPTPGGTLRASKERGHAPMLPAPPTRGLPPPCESPARRHLGLDKYGPSHGSRARQQAVRYANLCNLVLVAIECRTHR